MTQEMSIKEASCLDLWWLFYSAEKNHLCSFGPEHHEEQFCEIILNLDKRFGRCLFQDILLKTFLILNSNGPFVWPSRSTCAILVEGIMRNNSVKLF